MEFHTKKPPCHLEELSLLSVKTTVMPPTVALNDTVEVTIALKGDGWALGPKPIDAILVMDKSGSMSNYNVAQGVTRMQAA